LSTRNGTLEIQAENADDEAIDSYSDENLNILMNLLTDLLVLLVATRSCPLAIQVEDVDDEVIDSYSERNLDILIEYQKSDRASRAASVSATRIQKNRLELLEEQNRPTT